MKVIVDNLLVNYRDNGKGKLVLMLHGWGDSLETFNDLADSLSKTYRIIRLDFPGLGSSQRPKSDWYIQDYAEFLAKFLDKLDLNQIEAVVAHSFGGRVTIKGIAKRLINPKKVILIGSAGVKPSGKTKKSIYKAIAKTGKAVTSLPGVSKLQPKLRRNLYKMAGSTDYLRADEMQQIFINTVNEDLQSDASSILQPTLIIWGENDDQTPVSDAKKLHNAIKNSKLVILHSAGHFVHHDEKTKVENELKAFLS